MKVYHQQGAQLKDPDENINFIFGENNNCHQTGNAYLEYDITMLSPVAVFDNNSQIRLTKLDWHMFFKKLSWLLHRVQF